MHVSLKKQHQVLHVMMFFFARNVILEPNATKSVETDMILDLNFQKRMHVVFIHVQGCH